MARGRYCAVNGFCITGVIQVSTDKILGSRLRLFSLFVSSLPLDSVVSLLVGALDGLPWLLRLVWVHCLWRKGQKKEKKKEVKLTEKVDGII